MKDACSARHSIGYPHSQAIKVRAHNEQRFARPVRSMQATSASNHCPGCSSQPHPTLTRRGRSLLLEREDLAAIGNVEGGRQELLVLCLGRRGSLLPVALVLLAKAEVGNVEVDRTPVGDETIKLQARKQAVRLVSEVGEGCRGSRQLKLSIARRMRCSARSKRGGSNKKTCKPSPCPCQAS